MSFDPTVNTTQLVAGSFKHLRTRRGVDTCKTGTLDLTKFSKAAHYPNLFIPGGVVIAKLPSGLYAPYSGDTNEIQKIAVDATGGTFTITFRGTASAAIAFNATAAAVQAALELNPEIEHGDVVVTGGPGNAGATTPYFLAFGGQYAGMDVAAVTTGVGSLTGGAGTAAVTTTQGGAAGAVNEVQTLTVDASAGTYTLTFLGRTTAPIAFNATAATVQAAMEAAFGIAVNTIAVTGGVGASGGGTPYVFTFSGATYAGQNVALITSDATNLTGGAATATNVQTTQGSTGVASDGSQVATNVLFDRVPVLTRHNLYTAPTIAVVALMTEGDFIEANMPILTGTSGGIDAAGKAQLGPRFSWS